MKKINKITLVFLCAAGLFFTDACTKNYEEYNTDPRIITADLIDVGLLLTNVEADGIVGGASYGNGTYGAYCGMCKRDDDAPFLETDAPGEWDFEYQSQLNNLSNIIYLIDGKANKEELANKQAIARILKVWAVSKLTDTYGDVPYSESCLPKEQAILQPMYDTQQSIYADLFKELKEAAAQLDEAKVSYGSADLVYGGDPAKWRKLANSLRLRLALRVINVDKALATAQLSDLSEDDLLSTLGDDAFVKNSTK
ncbi:MAG: SusD/RagB family nutrient-binding outer membrane lipoprotein [Bacteroidales bacterium]|nr:SusD/RagB family nutrient-binding outer membrane lipoprotein [Bacteroidales bacterium]